MYVLLCWCVNAFFLRFNENVGVGNGNMFVIMLYCTSDSWYSAGLSEHASVANLCMCEREIVNVCDSKFLALAVRETTITYFFFIFFIIVSFGFVLCFCFFFF